MVDLRIGGRDERVTDEEWEERARAGRVPEHALVRIPAVTGDRFVEVTELQSWHALRAEAARRTLAASAGPPLFVALLIGLQIRLYSWALLPPVRATLLEAMVNFSPSVFEDRELWRPLTMGLLQVDFLHAGMNLLWSFFVGWALERTLGWVQVAVVFFSAVLVGSAFSTFASPWVPSLGSSGGVFGLVAALVTFGIARSELVSSRWSAAAGLFMAPYLAMTFWSGLSSEGVDNWCHLGGMLTGLVLGLVLDPPLQQRRKYWNRAVHAVVATVVLGGWLVVGVAGPRLEPLLDEQDVRRELRRRERPDEEQPEPSTAYRALRWSVPGGWRPERDAAGRAAFGSPVGPRAFSVSADPSDRPRPAEEHLAALMGAVRRDWPAATFEAPEPTTLDGHPATRVVGRTGTVDDRVLELVVATRGVWALTATWQVDAEAASRLAPLRDRLYAAVVWGDPEELVSAREAHAARPTADTRATLAAAAAAVGDRALVEELHAELLRSPRTDTWRAVLSDLVALGVGPRELDPLVEQLLASDPDGKALAAAADAYDLTGDPALARGLLVVAWDRVPGERALRRARRARNLSTTLLPDGRPWDRALDPVTRAPRTPAREGAPLTITSARAAADAHAAERAAVVDALRAHLAAGDRAAAADLSVLAQGDDRAEGEELTLLLDEALMEPPPAWLPPDAAAEARAAAAFVRSLRPAPQPDP